MCAYQTDAAGIYTKDMTRHGHLPGWARTDQAAMYRFDTIRSGAYPAEHIHMALDITLGKSVLGYKQENPK